MTKLKLFFSDFSGDFVPEQDFFYTLLAQRYQIELDRAHPDFLIYSCYGHNFLNYDCPRIFYTAENLRPDFNLCDYALGFDYLDFADRYLRFPNYARYGRQFESLVRENHWEKADLGRKSAFCNFIYSNAFADPTRDLFFQLLSQYRRVDSPGRHLNNLPNPAADRYASGWRESKVEFQRRYKFSIAFENSGAPGYTTEKLMHAFIADTVPIYWGNPLVGREFNSKAFINCHEFGSLAAVVQRVAELDADEDQYLAMLNEPPLMGNVIPSALKEATLLNYFNGIFSQPPAAAFRRPRHGTTLNYESTMRIVARLNEKNGCQSLGRRVLRRIKRTLLTSKKPSL